MKRNGIKYKNVAEMLRATLSKAEADVILKDKEERALFIAYDSRAQQGECPDLAIAFEVHKKDTLEGAIRAFAHILEMHGPYAIWSYELNHGDLTDEQWEMDIN